MNNTTSPNFNYTGRYRFRKGSEALHEFTKSSRYIFGILEGVMSPVIIIVNIIVIIAILSSPKLRQKFSYLLIVSISISEIITGLLSCPVRASVTIGQNYGHGCATYLFVTVYEEFVQNFVASWSMVSLNTDYLLTMFNARLPKLSEFRRRLVMATFIFLPWLTMCCVVFPIAFIYSGRVYFSDTFCQVNLNKQGKVVVIHLSYVIPAILLAIQVLLMTIAYARRIRNGSLVTSETTSPVMCIVASTVVVVFVSSLQLTVMVVQDKIVALGYRALITLLYTSVLLGDMSGAVLPFVWFLCPDIRASCLELYNKMPWRRSVDVPRGDLSVTYKNFE